MIELFDRVTCTDPDMAYYQGDDITSIVVLEIEKDGALVELIDCRNETVDIIWVGLDTLTKVER